MAQTGGSKEQILVEMKEITKTFPGVKALDKASLTLRKGEVLGLLGENGAGKSTLMNALGGVPQYQPDSGTIEIEGKEVQIHTVTEAAGLGVAFIHQEIALVPKLSVAENIYLGREIMSHGLVDKGKMMKESKQWLDMIGLDVSPATLVGDLPIGKRQMVEIAKACSLNMKLLIMDEPTSSLSEKEVRTLFEMIRHLKEIGIGIIYISHKMSEIFEITDRVCVMRDGGYVGTVVTKETNQDELVSMMVGRSLDQYYVRTYNEPGDVIFEVQGLSAGTRVIDCSFEVRRGEILGFYGLVGAGRSELLKASMGLYPRDKGTVRLKGEDITNLPTMKIQEKGLVLIPEDRKLEGLILKKSISENIALSVVTKIVGMLHVNRKLERDIVDSGINDLNIRTPSRDQITGNLSGGNQQKVVVAKWLAANPDVLIMDEPTRGIDVGAKAEIYSKMNELAKQGKAIIMISSEMPEIINMSDRIIVMSDGRITGMLDRSEFSASAIGTLAFAEEDKKIS